MKTNALFIVAASLMSGFVQANCIEQYQRRADELRAEYLSHARETLHYGYEIRDGDKVGNLDKCSVASWSAIAAVQLVPGGVLIAPIVFSFQSMSMANKCRVLKSELKAVKAVVRF